MSEVNVLFGKNVSMLVGNVGGNNFTREMTMKKMILASMFMLGATAMAKPAVNTSGAKHPNINAAQKLVAQAFEKITAAQKANEYDMDGHAQKAKDLLDQANAELKLAAEAANANK